MREFLKRDSIEEYSTLALPPERYIPGFTTRPDESPVAEFSTNISLGLEYNEAFLYGIDLFNNGYYWEAHEAWEHLWIPRKESTEGMFLKGLIQVTASLVKRSQKNYSGEALLRQRALGYLRDSSLGQLLFTTDLTRVEFFNGDPILRLRSRGGD